MYYAYTHYIAQGSHPPESSASPEHFKRKSFRDFFPQVDSNEKQYNFKYINGAF